LDKRAEYTDKIIETVHKCASDPKTNREWLDSENPWQTLSSMIELSAAIKSGDPEKYESHLHVHVDGSCNGM
jgi:DNA-directed RNA polymerase